MDPQQLMMLLGQLPQFQQQQGGMSEGMPGQQMQGGTPGQMPGQLPQFGMDDKKKKKGIPPWAMLSPMAGMFAANPKMALTALSPGIGIANLLGAFK